MPPHGELGQEPDVSPEAALVFGSRVQPLLANQCVECHAKPDYQGKFKLARVTPIDAGPEATKANLRAVAAQLKKGDPGASPLLVKSLGARIIGCGAIVRFDSAPSEVEGVPIESLVDFDARMYESNEECTDCKKGATPEQVRY